MTPDAIREARRQLAMTQADLARLTWRSVSQVQHWESGRRGISPATWRRILAELAKRHHTLDLPTDSR